MDNESIWKALRESAEWRAEHDGRINAWWEAQRVWNDKLEARMNTYSKRLSAVEKRMVFFAGGAAAVGSGLGALIQGYL